MQDIHSLSGGGTPAAARLFAAAAAAGDRHLGLHHLTNQALKCPRCDSLNTKFCYYNNYNLAQPRHFCKSCRRYWTKGGVLRNVPVGGGCRKSRRSSSYKPPPSLSPSAAKPQPLDDSTTTSAANNNSNNNHSSSDSSTVTAAAPAEIPSLFHEYGSTCLEKPATDTMYGSVDITLERPISSGVGREDVSTRMLTGIGDFQVLMGSTAEITPFGYAGVLTQHDHPRQEMVGVEGFGALDWEGSGDENNGEDGVVGLFDDDMTGAVDHAYWSQQNQWTAADVDTDQHHHHHHHHQQQQQVRNGLFLP